ncbi:MFS transporter, partial [Streptomyces sp. MCAF7]
ITYTSGLIAPAAMGSIADATSLTASFGVVAVLTLGLVVGAGVLRGPAHEGAAAGGHADAAASSAAPR